MANRKNMNTKSRRSSGAAKKSSKRGGRTSSHNRRQSDTQTGTGVGSNRTENS